MVTELYLVRHCEALGNVTKVFQGVSDFDITERGQVQLNLLAERFKTVELDAVYSSPLIRAKKTADAINKYHNLPIKINKKLIEIDGGEIEGVCWVDFPTTRPVIEYHWLMEPHKFHVPGGEPMTNVYKRAWEAILEIINENKGKKVAIASHGCTIRNIICRAMGKPIEQLNSVDWADNTGVYLLHFDEEELPRIIYANDFSHLGADNLNNDTRIRKAKMEKPAELEKNL
ncbi:MAG: histidine phosphatase family protein [Clostridia bacterium]|nr:histidine phosphatase family protein [Clostridia bacterium]